MSPTARPAAPETLPLPVEPAYTLTAVSELLGLSTGRIQNILSEHKARFPVKRFMRGRHRKALRCRWLTGEEVRLVLELSRSRWQGERPKPWRRIMALVTESSRQD